MDLNILKILEDKIICGLLADAKRERVYFRRQNLEDHPIGIALGGFVDSDLIFAVDYYGFVRKSRGFHTTMIQARREASIVGHQVRYLTCPLLYFAGITMEDVVRFAHPTFLSDFCLLKGDLLKLRGFK